MVTAENGQEAFEVVNESVVGIRKGNFSLAIDLIVLDLNMPITNGYDACRQIKKYYEETKEVESHIEKKGEKSSIKARVQVNAPIIVASTGDEVDEVFERCR